MMAKPGLLFRSTVGAVLLLVLSATAATADTIEQQQDAENVVVLVVQNMT